MAQGIHARAYVSGWNIGRGTKQVRVGGDKVKIVTSASTATSTGGTAAAATIALVAVTALRLGGEGSRLEGEEVGVGDSSLAAAAALLALALLALANNEGRILRGAKQTVGHDQRHSWAGKRRSFWCSKRHLDGKYVLGADMRCKRQN